MLHTYFRKQPCLTLQRCQAGLFFNENVLLQIEFQNYRCCFNEIRFAMNYRENTPISNDFLKN